MNRKTGRIWPPTPATLFVCSAGFWLAVLHSPPQPSRSVACRDPVASMVTVGAWSQPSKRSSPRRCKPSSPSWLVQASPVGGEVRRPVPSDPWPLVPENDDHDDQLKVPGCPWACPGQLRTLPPLTVAPGPRP